MPYPGLLHSESLQQATADPDLHRRHSDTVLAHRTGSHSSVGWVCVLGPSRSEQLWQPGAWQAHCPRWAMHLNHLPGLNQAMSLLHHKSTISGVPYVSSGELISGCDPDHNLVEYTISGAETVAAPCLPALALASLFLCLQVGRGRYATS